MTTRDRWAKRDVVNRYYAYKDELNYLANRQKYVLGNTLSIIFYLPFPASWSQKKKAQFANKPHQSTPDLDNLIKAFTDALLVEDSHIHQIIACKIWAHQGSITIIESADASLAESGSLKVNPVIAK